MSSLSRLSSSGELKRVLLGSQAWSSFSSIFGHKKERRAHYLKGLVGHKAEGQRRSQGVFKFGGRTANTCYISNTREYKLYES